MAAKTDRVALVTGASSGIGEAAARALVGAGFTVYGTSRRATAGEKRGEVVFLPLDVTDDESVADAVREVLDRSGRIDVLVNNAGLGVVRRCRGELRRPGPALFETNLFGSIRMTKRRPAAHARAGQRKDHQRQLDCRSHSRPLHGVVRVEQARSRGLLRVGRPRGARARSPVLLVEPGFTKTCSTRILLRRETPASGLRPRTQDRRRRPCRRPEDRRRPPSCRQRHRRGRHRPKPEAQIPAGKTPAASARLRRYAPTTDLRQADPQDQPDDLVLTGRERDRGGTRVERVPSYSLPGPVLRCVSHPRSRSKCPSAWHRRTGLEARGAPPNRAI